MYVNESIWCYGCDITYDVWKHSYFQGMNTMVRCWWCIKVGIHEGDILTLLILNSQKRKYQVIRVKWGSYDLVYGVKKNYVR